jgi:WD40 repeat protein
MLQLNGTYLVTISFDRTQYFSIWNLNDYSLVRKFKANDRHFIAFAWLNNGNIVTIGNRLYNNGIYLEIWDIEKGNQSATFLLPSYYSPRAPILAFKNNQDEFAYFYSITYHIIGTQYYLATHSSLTGELKKNISYNIAYEPYSIVLIDDLYLAVSQSNYIYFYDTLDGNGTEFKKIRTSNSEEHTFATAKFNSTHLLCSFESYIFILDWKQEKFSARLEVYGN